MELVTASELAHYFDRLTATIEDQNLRFANLAGNNNLQNYFTRKEAADYLRISVAKLDDLVVKGKIGRVKIGDEAKAGVRYRRKDLDSFMEESTQKENV